MFALSAFLPLALFAAAGTGLVSAHPHHPRSAKEVEFQNVSRRSLSTCDNTMRKRALNSRAIERRALYAERAKLDRGLAKKDKRDLSEALSASHESDQEIGSQWERPEAIFSAESSCVLVPEVTAGPYYVADEYVRWDLTEDQDGVPLYMDLELIDVNTCEPVETNTYVDLWAANATGVYSGVASAGDFTDDESNLDTTFLRGLQATDEGGYVQFKTIFPGHYTGRAIHLHMAVHALNGTYQDNGTYTGGYMSHIGQLFFDQDLISQVEANAPYTENTQELTDNTDDDILANEAEGYDPVMEYVLLGDDVTDGILAWASIGINSTAIDYTAPAATLTEEGGVENEDFGGGGGAPPGGASGMPSGGAMPSGSAMP